MEEKGQIFEKSIQLINEAVVFDRKGELKEAVRLYIEGMDFLLQLIKYEEDTNNKEILVKKFNEYFSRTEVLKKSNYSSGRTKEKTTR